MIRVVGFLAVTILLAVWTTPPTWESYRRVSAASLITMTIGLLFRLAEAAEAFGES